MIKLQHPAIRYSLAIAAAAASLYLRFLLTPLLGQANVYHTVWLAVTFSAWFLGIGPSIVATLISVMGVWYWFLPPQLHSFAMPPRQHIYGMLGFLVFSGAIIALGESNRRGFASSFRLAAIVDGTDDAIVSKNLDGVVLSWNKSAERIFGWSSSEAVGKSITLIVPPELRHQETDILKRLRAGERINHFETVRITKGGARVDVSLTISPVRDATGRITGASKIARDITERKETERKLQAAHDALEDRVRERTAQLLAKHEELEKHTDTVRHLSGRILLLQDQERRRIARELHDSVGQHLAAIGMNLAIIAQEKDKMSAVVAECMDDNARLVQHVSDEIRTLSHLLHPPLLDQVGLESAIRDYVEGFAKRSKIDVAFDVSPNFPRLESEQEISLFRVVQECLTNIHRHSGSAKAAISLSEDDTHILLEIKDEGRGIPPEKRQAFDSHGELGVGMRGMRERVRQLGGALKINSSSKGTVVEVILPPENPPTPKPDATQL